jgi:hypothetical protein
LMIDYFSLCRPRRGLGGEGEVLHFPRIALRSIRGYLMAP